MESLDARPGPARYRVAGRGLTLSVFDLGLACCAVEFAAAVAGHPDLLPLAGEQADDEPGGLEVMVVSGTVTDKLAPSVLRPLRAAARAPVRRLVRLVRQLRRPYWDSYCVTKGVDQLLPVDVYVPGCPPRPEALLEGLRCSPGSRMSGVVAAAVVTALGSPRRHGVRRLRAGDGRRPARAAGSRRARRATAGADVLRLLSAVRPRRGRVRRGGARRDRRARRPRAGAYAVPREEPVLATATGLCTAARPGTSARPTRCSGSTSPAPSWLDPLLLPEGFGAAPAAQGLRARGPGRQAWPGAKDPAESGGRARRRSRPPGASARSGRSPGTWAPLTELAAAPAA